MALNVNHLALGAGPGDDFALDLDPPDDACYVIARQYFLDPERDRPADLHIEVVDGPPPASPTDAELAERWRAAAGFVTTMTRPPAAAPAASYISTVVNHIGEPAGWREDEGGGRGTPDQTYALGRFELDDDDALVMDVTVPQCTYASVAVWNRFGQTVDRRHHRSTLNQRELVADGEGRARVVLAHRDPGAANWLDTGGRRRGTVFWRFLLAEQRPEPIVSKVVAVDDVDG